jgi:hypothetical protein
MIRFNTILPPTVTVKGIGSSLSSSSGFLKTDHNAKSHIFCDMMPCGPSKVNRCFERTHRHYLHGRIINHATNQHEADMFWAGSSACCLLHVGFLTYSSTLKMETCSSETSAGFQRTTRRYTPEERTLHNHRCENLKSYRSPSACC